MNEESPTRDMDESYNLGISDPAEDENFSDTVRYGESIDMEEEEDAIDDVNVSLENSDDIIEDISQSECINKEGDADDADDDYVDNSMEDVASFNAMESSDELFNHASDPPVIITDNNKLGAVSDDVVEDSIEQVRNVVVINSDDNANLVFSNESSIDNREPTYLNHTDNNYVLSLNQPLSINKSSNNDRSLLNHSGHSGHNRLFYLNHPVAINLPSCDDRSLVNLETRFNILEHEYLQSMLDYKTLQLQFSTAQDDVSRLNRDLMQSLNKTMELEQKLMLKSSGMNSSENEMFVSHNTSIDERYADISSLRLQVSTAALTIADLRTIGMENFQFIERLKARVLPLSSQVDHVNEENVLLREHIKFLEEEVYQDSRIDTTVTPVRCTQESTQYRRDIDVKCKLLNDEISRLLDMYKEQKLTADNRAADIDRLLALHDRQCLILNQSLNQRNEEVNSLSTTISELRQQISDLQKSSSLPYLTPSKLINVNPLFSNENQVTDIRSMFIKVADELLIEKSEKIHLSKTLENILVEIKEREPLFEMQRREFELLFKTKSIIEEKLVQSNNNLVISQLQFNDILQKLQTLEAENKQFHSVVDMMKEQIARLLLSNDNEAKYSNDFAKYTFENIEELVESYNHVVSIIQGIVDVKILESENCNLRQQLQKINADYDAVKSTRYVDEIRLYEQSQLIESYKICLNKRNSDTCMNTLVPDVSLDDKCKLQLREISILQSTINDLQSKFHDALQKNHEISIDRNTKAVEVNIINEKLYLSQQCIDINNNDLNFALKFNDELSTLNVTLQTDFNKLSRDFHRANAKIVLLERERDRVRLERDLAVNSERHLLAEFEKYSVEKSRYHSVICELNSRLLETESTIISMKEFQSQQLNAAILDRNVLKLELEQISEESKLFLQSIINDSNKHRDRAGRLELELNSARNELLSIKENMSCSKSLSNNLMIPSIDSDAGKLPIFTDSDFNSRMNELNHEISLKNLHISRYEAIAAAAESSLSRLASEFRMYKDNSNSVISNLTRDNEMLQQRNVILLKQMEDCQKTSELVEMNLNNLAIENDHLKHLDETNKANSKALEFSLSSLERSLAESEDALKKEIMLHSEDLSAADAVKGDLFKTKNCLSFASEEVTAYKFEIELLKQSNTQLTVQTNDLRDNVVLLRSQLDSFSCPNLYSTKNSSCEGELREVVRYQSRQLQILEIKLEINDAESARRQRELELLQGQLVAARQQLSDEAARGAFRASTEAEHTRLLNDVRNMTKFKEINSLLRLEIDRCKESLQSWMNKCKNSELNVGELTKEISSIRQVIAVRDGEIFSCNAKLNRTLKDLSVVEENLKSELDNTVALKAELTRCNSEMLQLRERNTRLNRTAVEFKRKLTDVSDRCDLMSKDCELFRLEKDSADGRVKEAEAEAALARVTNNRNINKLQEMDKEVKNLKAQDASLDSLNSKIQELERLIKSSEEQVLSLKNELEICKSDLGKEKIDNERLRLILKKAQTTLKKKSEGDGQPPPKAPRPSL